MPVMDNRTLNRPGLDRLIRVLRDRGFHVLGPTIRDGAVVHGPIDSTADLPVGWTDDQDGGRYRLRKLPDAELFGYAVGPQGWKPFLFPSQQKLFQVTREGNDIRFEPEDISGERYAFLGVRSCDLHAIAVQDRVFAGRDFQDPLYQTRRRGCFIVAVNCGRPAGTCFCVSMNTGPQAAEGYDLCLTEINDAGRFRYLVEVGSDAGAEVLAALDGSAANDADVAAARNVSQQAVERMGRRMNTEGIRELLQGNAEHPRWDDVAKRCLACTNCTLVCPTCFCSTVEDVTDLQGDHAERVRKWDSCFNTEFSYLHGGSVRDSTRSKYRQWLTHKLASWYDQFDVSGCVGCGRCITWCPVGIDLTEETEAIRRTDGRAGGDGSNGPGIEETRDSGISG